MLEIYAEKTRRNSLFSEEVKKLRCEGVGSTAKS